MVVATTVTSKTLTSTALTVARRERYDEKPGVPADCSTWVLSLRVTVQPAGSGELVGHALTCSVVGLVPLVARRIVHRSPAR